MGPSVAQTITIVIARRKTRGEPARSDVLLAIFLNRLLFCMVSKYYHRTVEVWLNLLWKTGIILEFINYVTQLVALLLHTQGDR